jgi:AcrR family transcriptional regulator
LDDNGPVKTRPRGGYAKGDARREAIVEVATEVFGTLGYRAATMLQIAAACGISRTGLLHHFPTKESLLEAVLAQRDRTTSLVIPQPAGIEDHDLAVLQRLITVARHNTESPEIVNLFSVLSAEAGDAEHPAHAYFVERYATLRSHLEASLSSLLARGALVAGTDPGALAIEIIALMDGLQVQWVLSPDQVDMAAVLRHRIQAALVEPNNLDWRT